MRHASWRVFPLMFLFFVAACQGRFRFYDGEPRPPNEVCLVALHGDAVTKQQISTIPDGVPVPLEQIPDGMRLAYVERTADGKLWQYTPLGLYVHVLEIDGRSTGIGKRPKATEKCVELLPGKHVLLVRLYRSESAHYATSRSDTYVSSRSETEPVEVEFTAQATRVYAPVGELVGAVYKVPHARLGDACLLSIRDITGTIVGTTAQEYASARRG